MHNNKTSNRGSVQSVQQSKKGGSGEGGSQSSESPNATNKTKGHESRVGVGVQTAAANYQFSLRARTTIIGCIPRDDASHVGRPGTGRTAKTIRARAGNPESFQRRVRQ